MVLQRLISIAKNSKPGTTQVAVTPSVPAAELRDDQDRPRNSRLPWENDLRPQLSLASGGP
jgi:hypothetical protein